MVLNIKYLVVTIGAVFLSLGIGIMVGFNLNNSEIFSSEQLKLVEDMDNKLTELRAENENLSMELKESNNRKEQNRLDFEKFVEDSFHILTEGKLFDKNIALIQTTEDYFFHDLGNNLEKSGGNIGPHILIKNEISDVEYDENLDIFIEGEFSYEKLINLIISSMKTEDYETLYKLDEIGKISIISIGKTQAVSHIILLGGELKEENSSFESIGSNIIKQSKLKDIHVVGGEHSTAIYSEMQKFKSLGISTVDNVDQKIGILSLIYILDGEKGNFGIKYNSDRLFPKLR